MPRFTLEAVEDTPDGLIRNVMEFESHSLSDVLENVLLFLKGSGFNPKGSTLEVVEDE